MKLFFLFLICLKLLIAGEQGAARIGEFVDPENLMEVQDAANKAQNVKDGKEIYDATKGKTLSEMDKDKLKELGTEAVSKYQQSKNGMVYWFNKINKKMSKIIHATKNKVNKWRTTLPMLQSFADRSKNMFGDTYNFMTTFKIKDTWDFDRNFSKEMEWRIKNNKKLGLNIYDYMIMRTDDEKWMDEIFDAFRPDVDAQMRGFSLFNNKSAVSISDFDKRVYFIQDQAFGTIQKVRKYSEDEFKPSEDAPALTRQAYENRKINNLMEDINSDFTDQTAIHQDIMALQYEYSVKRSRIKDELAHLDLLWASLAIRNKENDEMEKFLMDEELKNLGHFNEKDLAKYMEDKFSSVKN